MSSTVLASAGFLYTQQPNGMLLGKESAEVEEGFKRTVYLDGSVWQRGIRERDDHLSNRYTSTFIIPSPDSDLPTQVDMIDKTLIVQLNPDGTTFTATGVERKGAKMILGTVASDQNVFITVFEKVDCPNGLWRLRFEPTNTQVDFKLSKVPSAVTDLSWVDSALLMQRNPSGTVMTAMPTEFRGRLEVIGTVTNDKGTFTAEFEKVEEDNGWHLKVSRHIYQAEIGSKEPSQKRQKLRKSRKYEEGLLRMQ